MACVGTVGPADDTCAEKLLVSVLTDLELLLSTCAFLPTTSSSSAVVYLMMWLASWMLWGTPRTLP